jgi:hypothetical protein
MTDAADDSGRPHRLTVGSDPQRKISDAQRSHGKPCARSPGGKLLYALGDRACDVLEFCREQRCAIAGFAHLGDDGMPRKEHLELRG